VFTPQLPSSNSIRVRMYKSVATDAVRPGLCIALGVVWCTYCFHIRRLGDGGVFV
jgi:hypothetical protein